MDQDINKRLLQIKDAAFGHSRCSALSKANYDCGTDALLALYAECSSSTALAKDKNVAKFLHNYEDTVKEVKDIRLKAEDFEVKSIIGQGHFGEVQVVHERSTGEVFAMKVLKKAHILQQADAAFFMQERDIMAWSTSPWITSLTYAFQDATNLYLVMDFHPGGDLLTVMERMEGPLGEEQAQFYLAEIAAGLEDLHKLGFVHRDVKPENVLIARSGHTKLADFGSAARLDKSGNVMESYLPVGTPEYIAPEVLTSLDKSANYGVCCDWWSLGVIAYELLYQFTPFEGETTSQTYAKIMNFKSSLSFPSDVGVSSNAQDLIRKLLRDSKERIGFEGVKSHPFFAHVHWDRLQETIPPYIPSVGAPDDTSNFESFEKKKDSGIPIQPLPGFSGKSLPFVGFTFIRYSSFLQELTDHAAVDAVNSGECITATLKTQLEGTRVELQEVKERKALLEKECIIYQNQLEEYHRRLEMERSEGRQQDAKALEMLAQLKEQSRLVQELRENEAKASREDLTRAAQQLEQDRIVASNKARRLQEDLKMAQEVRDAALKKAAELKAKLNELKQESRKEVDALRAKLGKVTKDAESKVVEMQNRLSEALEKYSEVIKKAKLLEETSKRLEYEQEQVKLNDKLDLAETVAKLKKELAVTQDSSLNSQTNLLDLKEQFELESQAHLAAKDQLESLKQVVKGLEAKLDAAEEKNRTLMNSENNQKARLQDMNQQLDDVIHERELLQKMIEEEKKSTIQQAANDREAIATLTSAKDLLESQLQELQQQFTVTTVTQSAREQSAPRIEKLVAEVSSLKSQLLSTERLLQDVQEKTKQTENQYKGHESRLKDQIKLLQDKLNAAFSKADEQTEKLFELQRSKRQLEQDNSSLKVAVSNTESLNRSLQAKLSKASEEAAKLERTGKELEAMQKELATETSMRNDLTSALSALQVEKERVRIGMNELEAALLSSEKRRESQELELCLLQQNMKSLEEQQSETQSTLQELKAQEEQWKERQRVLEGDLEIAEEQLDKAVGAAEKEKVARLAAEAKTSELLAALDAVNASHAEDMQQIQQQLMAQKQLAAKCSDEKILFERQLQLKELRLAEIEKEISTEKQLASKLFDDLHSLRREYNVLLAAHNKLAQECKQRQAQLAQVDHTLKEKESAESARSLQEMRLQATIAQQSKLIDYLQSATACSTSTPLGSMLNRSAGFRHSSRKSRDPSKQMAEWNYLKGLASRTKDDTSCDSQVPCLVSSTSHEANAKPKATSVDVVEATDAASSDSLAASSDPAPALQQNKKRIGGLIMQHNIPHSFKEKCVPIYKSYVCVLCKGNIKARQKLCKCTHCDIVCHSNCASFVPNTCGLPAELAEHMTGQEEPLPKRPRSELDTEEGTEKENCEEDVTACKRTASVVIRKERMTMIRQGSDLKVDGWLILESERLLFCTRDSSQGERRPNVHIRLQAPGATCVVAATTVDSSVKMTNAFILEQHSLTASTCYVFVAPDPESRDEWVKCLEKAIKGDTLTAPSITRELKAVSITPLRGSSQSLNLSVTSSMLDDSLV